METQEKRRIAYHVSMFIITVAILLVLIASYFAFMSVKVVEANVQPYRAITKEVQAGGVFVYEVDACKLKAVPSTVVRRFIDSKGTRYTQPAEESNIKTGCGVSRIPVTTPYNLPEGEYYLDIEIAYQVNPLRTENYRFYTENFLITKE